MIFLHLMVTLLSSTSTINQQKREEFELLFTSLLDTVAATAPNGVAAAPAKPQSLLDEEVVLDWMIAAVRYIEKNTTTVAPQKTDLTTQTQTQPQLLQTDRQTQTSVPITNVDCAETQTTTTTTTMCPVASLGTQTEPGAPPSKVSSASAPSTLPLVMCSETGGRRSLVDIQRSVPHDGLPNIGNTCYFNSALQLLFRVYGDDLLELSSARGAVPRQISNLANLVLHVRGKGGSPDTGSLLQSVCSLNPGAQQKFRVGLQSDSSSVASHVLSVIEWYSTPASERGATYYFQAMESDDVDGDEQWRRFCEKHPHAFTQSQCGQLLKETFCKNCGKQGADLPLYSGFAMLMVPASDKNLRNVQDAIDAWGNNSNLRMNDTCYYCKESGQWRQTRRISRFPECGVLLVTVNREYHDERGVARKHDDGVVLPGKVTFQGVGDATYAVRPVAACVHSGSVTGGHYYCEVADEQGSGTVTANDRCISRSSRGITTAATHGSLFAFIRE